MARLFAVLFALIAMLNPPQDARADEAAYTALLSRYVVASPDGVNRVRYGAWAANQQDRAALNAYVSGLERAQPSRMGRPEAMAYWINLYNAVTLQVILENYPVRSIRDIRSRTLDPRGLIGPWRTERVTVEGRRRTLDDIEHRILRPVYRDPRIHYAVNCASIGCPNLMARAWRAETLEADLDAGARGFINHPRGVRIGGDGSVRASSIFTWFAADFGPGVPGLLTHLRRYSEPAQAARLASVQAIAGFDYDWALNDAR